MTKIFRWCTWVLFVLLFTAGALAWFILQGEIDTLKTTQDDIDSSVISVADTLETLTSALKDLTNTYDQ